MREPGVPSFCSDTECFCFKSSAVAVAESLAEIDAYVIVGRGVGPQEAIPTDHTLRLIRYEGSEWSAIAPVFVDESRRFQELDITTVLSGRLKTDALFLGLYDTAGAASYTFVRDGLVREEYVYSVEEAECKSYSTWRTLDPFELGYEHVDSFLRELKVIPPLFWSPFEKVGQPIRAQQEIDADWEQIAEILIIDLKPRG